MRKPSAKCALLAAMLARHGWGIPMDEDSLLAIAAIDQHAYPAARDAFEIKSRLKHYEGWDRHDWV